MGLEHEMYPQFHIKGRTRKEVNVGKLKACIPLQL